jgi:hypothetical protein
MEVDFTIFVDVYFIDHVVDHAVELLIFNGVMLFFQRFLEVIGGYHTIAISVKIRENISQFLFALNILHLSISMVVITCPSVTKTTRNLWCRYRQRRLP